jgi:enoyl-CoA hydratase/carnithine racemase
MITLESRDKVAVLRLENGVTNAINPEFVRQITQALTEVREQYQGLVLSGGAKFFSIGFDLPALLPLDRPGMTRFFEEFEHMLLDLLRLPLPVACAIAGHAIAGGTILALTGDFRFAASGKKMVGLNEIRLGLPVPLLADLMLRQLVGDRAATTLLYGGELLTVSAAEEIGLLDKLVPEAELEDYCVKKIADLALFFRPAFAEIKANRVEPLLHRHHQHHQAKNQSFLDCWFSPTVQEWLRGAAKKF